MEPFYSMASLSIIHCHAWYFLSLEDGMMTGQDVEGHTSPCPEDELLAVPKARQLMVEHLVQRGFPAEFLLAGEYQPSPYSSGTDVSSTQKAVPCSDPRRGSRIEQGMCYYGKEEWQLALSMFQSALNDDPDNALAFNNICATQNRMGEFMKALEACRRALELSPDFDLARNNLAWSQSQLEAARIRAKEQETGGRPQAGRTGLLAGWGMPTSGSATIPQACAAGVRRWPLNLKTLSTATTWRWY